LDKILVDIHSQSQTTFLTNSDYQLDLLDGLAQNFEYRKQFKDKLLTYNKINLELDSFTKDYETLLKELDYISFLKDELEESNFDKIPYSDLEEELKKMKILRK
jgi:DNA repair protein RecN (Recombination protein N)